MKKHEIFVTIHTRHPPPQNGIREEDEVKKNTFDFHHFKGSP